MLHSMHREISCRLIHHLAAELKQGCYLFDIPRDESDNFLRLSLVLPPQAILHAEEEGSGDVGDREPL